MNSFGDKMNTNNARTRIPRRSANAKKRMHDLTAWLLTAVLVFEQVPTSAFAALAEEVAPEGQEQVVSTPEDAALPQEDAAAPENEGEGQEDAAPSDTGATEDEPAEADAAAEAEQSADADQTEAEPEPEAEPAPTPSDKQTTWTVTFKGNGGTLRDGAKADDLKNVAEGKRVSLPKRPFAREGYDFVGWNTVADPSAKGVKKDEALFVPDGVELKDLRYRYVVLTKDNASEEELKGAIETTDGKLIALVSWDVSADETTDKKGRKIETCDLSKRVTDGVLTLHAQWKEAASDDETLTGADYAQGDDIEAVDVQGEAAKSREAARKELVAATSVSSTAARSKAAELFDGAAGDGEGEEPTDPTEGEQTDPSTPPRSGDGTNIEQLTAKWITADTVNNNDLGLLYIKPGGDSTQSVRLQINYALSGEHNYGPGDVTITVPAHMFKDRTGKDVGTLAIPYPKEPSTKNDFNWKLVGDNYVLTNTKRMSAATKGYIQFAISGLVPHTLVDMEISDEFSAYIEVVTHKDNTIALRSNPLTAQFDTEARLSSVSKRAYGAPSRVPASSIPASQRIEGEDEYILVNWYVWAYTSANQPYTLSQVDTLPGDKVVMQNDDGTMTEIDAQGFILNATSEDGRELARGASGTSYSTGTTSYYYYSTAYPASQFEPDVNYTFHNDINMTLTEVDPETTNTNPNVSEVDPKLVTTAHTSAQTTWSYTNPKWEDPTGHFMVAKNGNDDKEQHGTVKSNYTHRSGYTSSFSDSHLWSKYTHGYYGIYSSGLNDIQDLYAEMGEEGSIRLSYTIDSVGYVMPWMFDSSTVLVDDEMAARKSINYSRPVTMTTMDTGVSIGRYSSKLQVGVDYDWVSVEFPDTPWIYYGRPQNINPDGSFTALTAGDGTFRYTRDSDLTHMPDIDFQVLLDGEWQHWATVSWKSGSRQITLADGTTVADGIVNMPAGAENFRSIVTLQNTSTDTEANIALQAAIDYDMRPVIALKTTEALNAMVADAFEKTNLPSMYFYNGANMTVARADTGEQITSIDRDGYDVVRGYTTDTMVYPSKSSRQSLADVDYENRVVTIHYSASVQERSIINDRKTYEQAIADGRLVAETHGFWRDLLPIGITPDLDTIRVRSGDKVVDAYTIEDYEGSGRTLMVVEVDLTPTPTTYRSGDMYYYQDVPTISFDATYDFDDIIDYGERVHNVISFESSNDIIGTIEHYRGEPDDPNGTGNISTPSAFSGNAEKGYMTDLNPDRDTPSFVYAGTWTKLDILSAARTSLSKDVMVNNDGYWSSGVYYEMPEEAPEGNKRTVYEGGQYTYRLRVMSDDSTISSNIVVYDSLETFYASGDEEGENDIIDVDAPRWNGKLRSVDVSQLVDMGCAPVVYYSTVKNLQLSDESDPYSGNYANMDLTDSAIWVKSTDYTGSLDDVTAVAIDASMGEDEKPFELQPLESITALVNMQAPSGEEAREILAQKGAWGDSAQAYNNAYMTNDYTDVDTGQFEAGEFVRKDYTKVGLMEYNYHVTKVWDDDNNRDGLRPEPDEETGLYPMAFHLLADGVDTGLVAYIDSETLEATFEHIPYTKPNGDKIHYTVREEAPEGYTVSPQMEEANATITNKHVPERTSVSGEKTWLGDESDPSTRPESITVQLYANGKLAQSKVVKPDSTGNWSYSFDNLFKYENGKEIEYTVREFLTGKGSSYSAEVDGFDLINTYHPFGELLVSKKIEGTSEVSAKTEFPFTFTFTTVDDEGETVPVSDAFDYDILEDGVVVSSGTMEGEERTVAIKGGQSILVKEIPEGISYKVVEEQQEGFVQTKATGTSGEIPPNQTTKAEFVNTYQATGQINLAAIKTLLNREVKNYQFKFELYQLVDGVNDEGEPVQEEVLVGTAANTNPTATVTRPDGTIESSTAPVAFGALTFTQDDNGKTFTYKIKEVATGRPGYTYDDTEYVVQVSVADNGDGTLTITPTYYGPVTHEYLFGLIKIEDLEVVESASFENVYEADGETTLRAWKDLKGRRLTDEEFTFELLNENGEVIDTAKSAEDGTVTFETIAYDETDIGNTYHYAIREVEGSDDTVRYDSTYFGYAVTIIDNEDGTLYAEQKTVTPVLASGSDGSAQETVTFTDWVEEGAETPIFKNTLEPGSLTVQKNVLDADDADPDQEFVFKVKLIGEEAAFLELPGTRKNADGTEEEFLLGEDDLVVTTSGEAFCTEFELRLKGGASATFEGIPAGTAYQVYEQTVDGWVLAEQTNISGSIEALEESAAVFTNRYQPGVTTAQFSGTKTLDGLAAEADAFTFTLSEDGEVLQTKPTLDGGFVQFDPIVYEKKDVGEHTYTIAEVDPEDDTLDWDTHTETVTVVVTENPDGTLTSEVTYDTDGFVFANKTRPGNLRITKVAENPTPANKDDVFTFKVTLTNDKGMPLGENDEIYWYVEDASGNPVTTTQQSSSPAQGAPAVRTATPENSLPLKLSAEIGTHVSVPAAASPATSDPALILAQASAQVSTPAKAAPAAAEEFAGAGGDYSYILGIEPTTTAVRASGNLINPAGGASQVKWTLYQDGVLVVEPINGVSGTFTGGSATTGTSPTGPMQAWPWFNYNGYITKVLFKGNVKITGEAVSMFRGEENGYYPRLEEIDFSGLDTSSLTRIRSLLYKLPALKRVNLWNWSTANIRTSTTDCMNWFLFENPKLEVVIIGPNFNFVTKSDMTEYGNWRRVDNDDPASPISWSSVIYRSGDDLTGVWAKDGVEFAVHRGYVVFDGNGGFPNTERVMGKSETETIVMPDPDHTTMPHYVLVGWNTERDGGGTNYTPGQGYNNIVVIDETVTLYAQWEETNLRAYRVQHYLQNESRTGYTLTETEVFDKISNMADYGTEVTPAVKSYDGYVAPEPQTATVLEDDSLVVRYYYDMAHYDVVYDGNGATSGQMLDTHRFYVNHADTLRPNQYQKKGAIFNGWNTKADGTGTSYTDQQQVNNLTKTNGETVTLYAQWLENPNEALEPTAGVIYVTCKAGETIVIPDLPDGTTYTVEEVDLPTGWTQSGAIEGDSDAIAANQDKQATATNRYIAEGYAQIVAHKRVTGGKLANGEYTFELLDSSRRPIQTATNDEVDESQTVADENGNESANAWYQTAPVTFEPLEYTQEDIGKTYTYYVRETVGNKSELTYDEHLETVRVHIEDGGHGTLATTVTYDSDGALFSNVYKESSLTISKTIENASEAASNDEFTYVVELFDADGNPLEGSYPYRKKTTEYVPVTSRTETRYSHTPNVNDQGVASGTYANNLSRNHVVTIPGATNLHIKVWFSTESATWDWLCIYPPGVTPTQYNYNSATISGGKLAGGALKTRPTSSNYIREYDVSGNTAQFFFRSDGSGTYYGYYAIITGEVPVPEQGVEEGNVAHGGTVTLKGGESLTITGLPNGATYKVTEQPKQDWELTSKTGDEGSLVGGQESSASFVNAYQIPPGSPYSATGRAQIVATKTVSEGVLSEDDGYQFELLSMDGEVLQTKGVDEFGESTSTITFDPILYTLPDAGQTYTYLVREVEGSDESVTYDKHVYTVEVHVTDTGQGALNCDVRYVTFEEREDPETGDMVEVPVTNEDGGKFVNTVNRTSIAGQKVWDDEDSAVNARPESITVRLLANDRVVESMEVTPDTDGNWSFEFKNLPKLDGVTYSVEELPVAGYTSTTTQDDDGNYIITNKRIPNTLIEFDKFITGPASSGQKFTFTLVETDETGTPLESDDAYFASTINSVFKDGVAKVSFPIEDIPVGEHYYVAAEEPAEGNVTTDPMRYLVHVSVSEDGKVSEPEYFLMDEEGWIDTEADPAPAFYNNVTAKGVTFHSTAVRGLAVTGSRVSVYPEVQKYLDGSVGSLAGGDYSFTLSGEGVSRTKTNDILGKVAFYDEDEMSGLVYDEPGVHTYTIVENIPEDATDNGDGTFTHEGIVYDGSTITMTVTVTEKDGVLDAEVAYTGMRQGTEAAFYNRTVNDIAVPNAQVMLSVDKYSAGNHEYLSGAKFALYKVDGGKRTLVEEFTTKGAMYELSTPLEAGASYVLVETAAPAGYATVSDTEFTVAPNGSGIMFVSRDSTTELVSASRIALYDPTQQVKEIVKTVTRNTTRTVMPSTGDLSRPWLVGVLAFFGSAAMVLAVWLRRRRGDDDHHDDDK